MCHYGAPLGAARCRLSAAPKGDCASLPPLEGTPAPANSSRPGLAWAGSVIQPSCSGVPPCLSPRLQGRHLNFGLASKSTLANSSALREGPGRVGKTVTSVKDCQKGRNEGLSSVPFSIRKFFPLSTQLPLAEACFLSLGPQGRWRIRLASRR